MMQQRRSELAQDSSTGSNTRGGKTNQQMRASSQNNMFHRASVNQGSVNKSGEGTGGGSSNAAVELHDKHKLQNNVYKNMNREYEQPNVLTLEENSAKIQFNTFLQAEPNNSSSEQSPSKVRNQHYNPQ